MSFAGTKNCAIASPLSSAARCCVTNAEHTVGGYALDLIGRDLTNGRVVIIENQLADSGHTHLGQLLTYAAGTSAATIIWLTTRFRDEHRQAMTWLNEHTDEDTHFFGVELQVVRIGESAPAPAIQDSGRA
jgi:hypothetical protein